MPKINELPRAQTLAATDLLAKDNPSGTSTEGVSASQIADYVRSTIPVDNAPTDDSDNFVKSNGVFDADEMIRGSVSELKNNLFKVPYTPSNMSVDSNGKIALIKGYVSASTGASTGTTSGKYYRTQAGSAGLNSFLEIGDKPLYITCENVDFAEWTCWSYSGITNASATHSNTNQKYQSCSEPIFIPHNATDKRFAFSVRTLGASDSDRPEFTDAQITTIKNNIKFWVATDDTLSIVGAAADAQKTGDVVESLKDRDNLIEVKSPDGLFNWNFVSGGIYVSGDTAGQTFTSSNYYRLETSSGGIYPILYHETILSLDNPDYEWTAYTYSSGTYDSGVRSLTNGKYLLGNCSIKLTYQANDNQFSVGIRRKDKAAMINDDLNAISAAFKVWRKGSNRTDKILLLGDSITRGRLGGQSTNARWPYPNQVAEQLGIVCENFGIGNIGWIAGYSSDSTNKTNALGYLKRVGNSTYYDYTSAWNGYKFIGRGGWDDFNTIMFCLGVNDLNYTVGSIKDIDETLSYSEVMAWNTSAQDSDSENRTIIKAMYKTIRWIRESEANHGENEPYVPGGKYKNIIICDPVNGISTTFKTNLIELYAEFCDRYGCAHVSCTDVPIDRRLHSSDYLPDNVHPNEATYASLSRYISAKLSGLSSVPSTASRILEMRDWIGVDFLKKYGTFSTSTSNGITFNWSQYPKCTISGTRGSSQAIYSIYNKRNALPIGMRPGDRFLLRYSDSLWSANLQWYVFFWNVNGYSWNFSTRTWVDSTSQYARGYLTEPFTIPDGCVGMTVQLRVPSGNTSFSGTIYYIELIKMKKLDMPTKLLVSFIDDDTSGYEYVRKYREACRHNGVFGNYAVLTRYSEDDYTGSGWTGPEMRQRLLAYEDEGFGMLTHLWRQSTDDPWQNLGSDEAKIAQCRGVLLKGLREMREFGFVNYNYWVTPYGVKASQIKRMAREAGVECLISTNNGRCNSMQDYEKDFIKRVALNKDDTRPSGVANAMQDVKDAIDATVAAGAGWLIITTHFNEWGSLTWDSTLDANGFETGYARFNEMVQYALNAGLTPMTFPRVWTYYKPILEANNAIVEEVIGQG